MKRFLTLALVLFGFGLSAKADTITLDSASNGTYKYSFTQDDNSCDYEYFKAGSQFVISGLSGVTGASTLYSSFITTTFTSTSATFTLNSLIGVSAGTFADIFTITSNVLTTGTVSFSIPTGSTATTGSLQGPVAIAATPEPSSLSLLGIGLVGIAVFAFHRARSSSAVVAPRGGSLA